MLDPIDRQFVQRVKEAEEITVVVNVGETGELRLKFSARRNDIKKLRHDIAIAIQDYYVRNGSRKSFQRGGRAGNRCGDVGLAERLSL